MKPFLSLCIPTYQRVTYLKDLLSTILPQLKDEVEIVISDNGSTDGTEGFIKGLKCPSIFYSKLDTTVPCGQNLMRSVALAKGRYCWLMSDDDILESDSVEVLTRFLKKHQDIPGCSVNVKGYDKTLMREKKIFNRPKMRVDRVYSDKNKAFLDLGSWFGFFSAHIVRKDLWEKAQSSKEYLKYEGYHHFYLLSSILSEHSCWGFVAKNLVGYRADNESYSQEYGRWRRFAIDVKAFSEIPSLFMTKKVCRKTKKKVIKQLLFWQMLRAKCEGLTIKNHLLILFIGGQYFYNLKEFWLLLFPLLLIPQVFLKFFRTLYHLVKK